MASLSSLPLIDISEPTENVLWELEELTRRFGDKCVIIGHYEQVAALTAFHPETEVLPLSSAVWPIYLMVERCWPTQQTSEG